MNPVLGKLQSVAWFLRRPKLYPQLFHLAKERLLRREEPDTRAEATRWCDERAVGLAEALHRITGASLDEPVERKFASVFAQAQASADACPVKMGGAGALDLLYWCARRIGAQKIVETGVAYGWSSLALLLAIEDQPEARLISTDMPYIRGNNDDYVGVVVPQKLKPRWKLIRLPDRQGLPRALSELGRLDLCHYDSDKTYGGRMWAYPKLWQALRPGGCFISDDISDNVGFRDFAKQVGVQPVVVKADLNGHIRYVGVLTKPA